MHSGIKGTALANKEEGKLACGIFRLCDARDPAVIDTELASHTYITKGNS
jgi:hypothetical protein